VLDPALDGRQYGGRSAAERRAARRSRMLATGLQMFGTLGWSASVVERLCSHASVATRSFYEEFGNREELLLAVYAEVIDGAAAAVASALAEAPDNLEGRVGAGLAAYVGFMTSDPRRAQVAHREVRAAGVLERERREGVLTFAALVEAEGERLVALGERRQGPGRLMALSLAGAVNELLIDWIAERAPRPPVQPLVSELTELFVRGLRP